MAVSNAVAQPVPGFADGFQRSGHVFSAGKAAVVQPLVQRQLVRLPEYRIGHCPRPGQGRQYAVPGITLQPVQVATSTDVRRALESQVDMTAPGELQLDPFELRENTFQARPGCAGDI